MFARVFVSSLIFAGVVSSSALAENIVSTRTCMRYAAEVAHMGGIGSITCRRLSDAASDVVENITPDERIVGEASCFRLVDAANAANTDHIYECGKYQPGAYVIFSVY